MLVNIFLTFVVLSCTSELTSQYYANQHKWHKADMYHQLAVLGVYMGIGVAIASLAFLVLAY